MTFTSCPCVSIFTESRGVLTFASKAHLSVSNEREVTIGSRLASPLLR